VNSGGFGAQFQWTADQKYSPADGAQTYNYTAACGTATPPTTGCSKQNGAGLVELKYDGKIGSKGSWGLFGAAAYTDVKQISTDSKRATATVTGKRVVLLALLT